MSTSVTTRVELTEYNNSSAPTYEDIEPHRNEPIPPQESFSLPPTDGGKDAWLFLFACFMLEGLIWGT